jgi:succinate-semialdehyde dehydrogenase / glutarate-semialdehyde dehydrogenase
MIQSINPATNEVLKNYQEMAPATVTDIVNKTHEAFLGWRHTAFRDRAHLMRKAAEILRANAREYALLMAQEMGKPVRDGIAEAQKCATGCDFYAEHGERFLAREEVTTEARKSFVTFNPLGVILAVMPWNFPFWQVFRFAAPGLMAGNAGVLKHASNVPGCALAIEDVFRRAGFPENLFRTLMIGSRQVDAVIERPLVRAVTLTGSGPAGRAVARKAGEMLKKTVLELGGSDPYLVLEDADLELAAAICTKGRLVNSGFVVVGRGALSHISQNRWWIICSGILGDPSSEQATCTLREACFYLVMCIAAKRFIVIDSRDYSS